MRKQIMSILCLMLVYVLQAGGYYLEYKMTALENGQTTEMGGMKMYALSGNSRVESNVSIAGLPAQTQTTLHLVSNPEVSYWLNTADKTYTEVKESEDTEDPDLAKDEYAISLLGNETVNGYASVHIRVSRKSDNKELMQMWISTAINDYSTLSKIKSRYTGKTNLYAAMESAGVRGFPVRIQSTERGHQVRIDLLKVETRELAPSLFSLEGYTKTQIQVIPPQLNKGMSPEDQKKFIESMIQQQMVPANTVPKL